MIRESTSRIDKDLKVELRQTAFDMWMGCYGQEDIAEAVGYSEKSIREFLDLLRTRGNGTDSDSPVSSKSHTLTKTDSKDREFDEDMQASISVTR